MCQRPGAGPGTLPNAIINGRGFKQPGDNESELTIAAFGDIVVAGFNDCAGAHMPSLRNGTVGWAFSTDGGQTWRDRGSQGALEKVQPSDFGVWSDPSLAVDAAGSFYFSNMYTEVGAGFYPKSITVHTGHYDLISGNVIWGPPSLAFLSPAGVSGADKPHISVDPNTSGAGVIVYVAFTQNTQNVNGAISVVRSTDGARTWSEPVIVSTSHVTEPPLGAIPRVGPNGEIYVAWEGNWGGNAGRTIKIVKSSTMNWPSFSPELIVSSVIKTDPIPFFNPGRMNDFPTMGVDTSAGPNRGRVYIAWNDGGFGSGCPDALRASNKIGSILLSHSPDGLSNWSSPPTMINDDGHPSLTCTDHFFPWLSVDPNGGVHLGWYDRRLRSPPGRYDLTDVFAATFTVAGGISTNVRLTSCSFSTNVQANCQPGFGDYNGGYATANRFHYAWGDGRNGDPDSYTGGLILP